MKSALAYHSSPANSEIHLRGTMGIKIIAEDHKGVRDEVKAS
jgi:hypothetical protein